MTENAVEKGDVFLIGYFCAAKSASICLYFLMQVEHRDEVACTPSRICSQTSQALVLL